jgi:hypothetical protein
MDAYHFPQFQRFFVFWLYAISGVAQPDHGGRDQPPFGPSKSGV